MGRSAAQHEVHKAAIAAAALDCFAQYGYEGATNKRIAEAAGMKSTGLIYHYFPSKEDLFQACIQSIGALDTLHEQFDQQHDQPPEVYLRHVGTTFLGILRQERLSKFVAMVFSAIQSHPELPPIVLRRVAPVILIPVGSYLQSQMDLGVLKPAPIIAALQQFMGPLLFYAIIRRVVQVELPFPMPTEEEFVDNLVSTYLDGLRKRAGTAI